jgi:prefoldin subunit 5
MTTQALPLADRVVSRLRGVGRAISREVLRNEVQQLETMKRDLEQRLAAVGSTKRELELELEQKIAAGDHANGPWGPGHFYSPVPNRAEVAQRANELFPAVSPSTLPGIDLNDAGQLALLEAFKPYRDELPFRPEGAPEGLRGVFFNTMYCGTEGALLYFMMRHLKPKRIVEIGSGYSTCFALDTNERFFNNSIKMTLIEPYTERLRSLIRPDDFKQIELLEKTLQEVPAETFSRLQPNDIVFIDSTHVSKIGSDVNRLFFELLPSLPAGVFIHIHDIFYPFEYPRDWLEKGYFWNEAYLLRAFLQYNPRFRIEFFHDFMLKHHREKLLADFPVLSWGQSIWLQKL